MHNVFSAFTKRQMTSQSIVTITDTRFFRRNELKNTFTHTQAVTRYTKAHLPTQLKQCLRLNHVDTK